MNRPGIDQAFVLAAGFGTRLRPLTHSRPKPLLPICNRPLIGLLVDHLIESGIKKIGLNCHYLADQTASFGRSLADRVETVIYREPEILGVGGGLGQAAGQFGDRSLLAVNGDVAFDIDLTVAVERSLASGAGATMVLHDRPGLNQVLVEGDRVVGFRDDPLPSGGRRLAYTCIQIIRPEVFAYLPADRPGDLIAAYRRFIADGGVLRAEVVEPAPFWTDIGRLDDYLDLHRQMLLHGLKLWGYGVEGPVLLGRGAEMAPGVEVSGFVCLGEDVRVAAGARLRDAVIMDRARIGPEAVIDRGAVGPGMEFNGRLRGQAVAAACPA